MTIRAGGRLVLGAIAIAITLSPSPSFAQAAFADGGFDSQAASVATYCYSCPSGIWSLYGAGFVGPSGIAGWSAPAAVSPSAFVFLQGQAYVKQVITVPTSDNIFVYWLASRADYCSTAGNQSVKVTLAGQVVAQNALTSGQPFRRYVSGSISLAAGTSYALTIGGMSTTGDNTAFVDSVSIVPAASATTYTYDALGRLTGVSSTGGANSGQASNYTYDKAGNRTHVTVSGAN